MAYWRKPVLALGLALAVVSIGGFAYAQAEDAIKARKDGFQIFRTSAGAIKGVVDGKGTAADAVAPANAIAAQAAKQVSHFPVGSDKGNTKAKPEIWANMADFTTKMKTLEDAAKAIAMAGGAGNLDAVKAGFSALGGACGACHKVYRND